MPAAIAVLRGDALVTAHYRLGLGVNAAFRTLRGWQARSHRGSIGVIA